MARAARGIAPMSPIRGDTIVAHRAVNRRRRRRASRRVRAGRRARVHRHPHARAARHLRSADGRQLRAPGRHDDDRRAPTGLADAARAVSGEGRGDAHHAELRQLRRPGIGADVGHRRRQPRGDPRRDREDAGHRAAGDGRRRFGLSSGLFYVPGTFTPTAEVVELARVAGRARRHLHLAHARGSRGRPRQRARDDRDRRARRAADAGHAPQGRRQGELGHAGRLAAPRSTRRVPAASTPRSTSIPTRRRPRPSGRHCCRHGRSRAARGDAARLTDPATRAGSAAAPPSSSTSVAAAIRRTSSALALRLGPGAGTARPRRNHTSAGCRSTIENAAETALWIVEQGGCPGIFHAIDEDDLERILVHPATMIASDGEVTVFGKTQPASAQLRHFRPRARRYVRERSGCRSRTPCGRCPRSPRSGSASPIAACSGRAESRHRGLRSGDRRDTATFDTPHQYAEGVSVVMVNGEVVFENGRMTAARPGQGVETTIDVVPPGATACPRVIVGRPADVAEDRSSDASSPE